MVIIVCLYVVALWLVFSKFRLVKWGWLSGTISLLIGGLVLATFLALFNYLTPLGRVTVTGRVLEVTPNVTGQIVAIPAKPNVEGQRVVSDRPGPIPVQGHAIAGLAGRGKAADQNSKGELRASDSECHRAQRAEYNAKRLADIQTLASDDANSQLKAQVDSEIGGVNTSVRASSGTAR
ncbi:hypothetical protein [Bradyrhizobium sp. 172]|uniref:hypothetical protein n=1 Tax=Bradyrhizobium sp. 172 TaxID=2782643 RepID=UPI001FFFD6A0|nr:hypothetical protein [Bradyrhizobium sp. 172]